MAPSWTLKRAAARTRRRLKAVKAKVEQTAIAIGGDWGDENQYMVDLADRMRDALDPVIDEINEALAALEEVA